MYPYWGYLTPLCGYCPFSIQPAEKTNKEDDKHKYRCMDEDNRLDEDKQSTALASETPEATMQGHKDKVYKNDYVSGFVPNHNHGSVDYTSVAEGHVHQCLDISYPPTPAGDGAHKHYTEGYVLFEDGHNHHYKAWSGPAIPVGSGMHVHSYDFYTTVDNGHRHHVKGVDMPAPGTL